MKKRYILNFSAESFDEPITYNLVKKFDIKINIFNALINAGEEGKLALEMEAPKKNLKDAIEYLKKMNVGCEPLEKKIHFKEEECVHCGACTAVCFTGALSISTSTDKLDFDYDKCIVCERCTESCPLRLFYIDFVDSDV